MTSLRRTSLVSLTLILLLAGAVYVHRRYPTREIAGTPWLGTLDCDLTAGWCPAGWGWGAWTRDGSGLTGSAPADSFAVYFFCQPSRGGSAEPTAIFDGIGNSDRPCAPFRHGGDFVMETEVRLLAGALDRSAEVQLLIRESHAVMAETGLALVAGRRSTILRYRADGVDYILGSWPLPFTLEYGRWYRMTFISADGQIRAEVDGTPVFDSRADPLPPRLRGWMDSVDADPRVLPPAVFVEPHVAVKNGTAEFRAVRLFVRPDDRWAFVR